MMYFDDLTVWLGVKIRIVKPCCKFVIPHVPLHMSGRCPNGGHNLMVLATILKTKGFRYWICALLMTSLFLQNLMRKSVMY